MSGAGNGVPVGNTPDDAALIAGPSGAVGPGVSGLLLPSSPGFSPSPTDWRWVEDNVEFSCSQVAATERLLH
jgi:hypothetical protein